MLEHWDHGFKSSLRHGCMSVFFSVVLSCVGRALVIGQSPDQEILPQCLERFILSQANSESMKGTTMYTYIPTYCWCPQYGYKLESHLKWEELIVKSHGSSVSIVTGYRLDDWDSRVQFPVGAGNFSLHHHVQNSSVAHSASYPMGTRGSFPGSKVAEL
jgi:hypothetical protein